MRARLLACLLPLLAACGPEGEVLFLERDGATMPIWIRGQVEEGVYVLWVHGGPGSSSLYNPHYPFFRALEERYAVAYWDQRASGSSQGNIDPAEVTFDDYVLDADGVIDLLRAQPGFRRLFVVGHSWGGTVMPAYLLDPARQAKVDGYVHMDGSHNVVLGLELAQAWMQEKIPELLATGEDPTLWEEARAFYERVPTIDDVAKLNQHIGYVRQAGGYLYEPTPGVGMGEMLFTPADMPSQIDRSEMVLAEAVGLVHVNLSPRMKEIRIPSLVMWGRHDGTLPVGLAQDAFDALGTPEADKRLVIFEKSAHSPYREEPELAVEAVVDFVEAYR